ncbi:MAG: GtrA family protein [Alphaproteobacteria bacterium]
MRDIVRSHYKSFSKFSVVGALNTIIDFSIFFVLNDIVGIGFVGAHICAFFVALANSFIINALWTFKNLKRDQLIKQISSFVVIGLIGLILSTLTIYIVGSYTNVYLAKILAMFVSFSWNYVGSWLFVFKD